MDNLKCSQMGYLNILLSGHWLNVFPMKKENKKK